MQLLIFGTAARPILLSIGFSVDLLSYDNRSTVLIRLDRRKVWTRMVVVRTCVCARAAAAASVVRACHLTLSDPSYTILGSSLSLHGTPSPTRLLIIFKQ